MSRYIGKRVSYPCGGCRKQFTLNRKSVDDSMNSGQVFCSKDCQEQFYLSVLSHRCSFKNYGEEERKCRECGYVVPNTNNDAKALIDTINATNEKPKCVYNGG